MTAFDAAATIAYADGSMAVSVVPSRSVRSVKLRVIGGVVELRDDVPRSTTDCPADRTRCGHVRCEWHMWRIDGDDRPGRRHPNNGPRTSTLRPVHLEWPLPPACWLEVFGRATSEGWTPKQMAASFGMGYWGFRYLLNKSLRKLKAMAADRKLSIEDFVDELRSVGVPKP